MDQVDRQAARRTAGPPPGPGRRGAHLAATRAGAPQVVPATRSGPGSLPLGPPGAGQAGGRSRGARNPRPAAGRPAAAVRWGGALVAAGLLMAACSSGSSTSTASTARPAHQASSTTMAGPPTVKAASNPKLGATILVNSAGLTLYTLAKDSPGHSTCTGSCASIWPPLTLSSSQGSPVAGPGVSGLGTLTRPDGTVQVTYQGMPLYTYTGDHAPGDANGEGVGGVWHVVKVSAGSAASAPTSTAAPTTSSGGGGYGY
jgi:predicted lipoprotein with Yx(FWY)xxD motif